MIGHLLRHDAMVRALAPTLLLVAALMGLLGSSLLDTIDSFQELSSNSAASNADSVDLHLFVTILLALQAVSISVLLTMVMAHKRDGTQLLPRSQPMELLLPIAPRAAWGARLIAHGLAIVGPLVVILVLLGSRQVAPLTPTLAKIGAACTSVVLFGFGLAPGRATLNKRSDVILLVGALVLAMGLLGYDLGVFQDEAPGGHRFAIELVLVAAVCWAVRAYRQLPASWSLSGQGAPRAIDRPAVTAATAGADVLTPSGDPSPATAVVSTPSARASWWLLIATTVWPLNTYALCLPAVWLPPFAWATMNLPLIAVIAAVFLLLIQVKQLLSRLALVSTLPVSRARLLVVGLAPVVLSLVVGSLLARGWTVWRHGERPVVTLDRQLGNVSPGGGLETWMDVDVPLRHWRLAGSDGVPAQTAPDGEQRAPRAIHPLGLPFVTVFNPYDAPLGSSLQFTAWQFSRALEAEHGVPLDAAELSAAYLETDTRGHLNYSQAQRSRSRAAREADDRPWYGQLGTLVADHPELASRWNPRRAALPVLSIALLSALAGAFLLAVRPGSRTSKLLMIALPPSLVIGISGDMWLARWLGPAHPQVLFAIAGRTLLAWLPDSTVLVWSLTALVVAGAVWVLTWAFERTELPMHQTPRAL